MPYTPPGYDPGTSGAPSPPLVDQPVGVYFAQTYFPSTYFSPWYFPGTTQLAAVAAIDDDIFLDIVARLEATKAFEAVERVDGNAPNLLRAGDYHAALVRDTGVYDETAIQTGMLEHRHEFEVEVSARAGSQAEQYRQLKWLERVAKQAIHGKSLGPNITDASWTVLESDRIEGSHPQRAAILRGTFVFEFKEAGGWSVAEPD